MPCVFIRLAGCNLRCSYCDAKYTYEEKGFEQTLEDLLDITRKHSSSLVEITGGEPLLQENVYPLMTMLLQEKRTVLLETNGAISLSRVPSDVIKIMDIKCPGSGMHEKMDTDNKNFLVVGPWRHGGWARTNGRKLWDIDFDSNTSVYFKINVEAPWFAYHLKDKDNLELPEALIFITGANRWERYEEWPPTYMTKDKKLYFHAKEGLSFDQPTDNRYSAFDKYVSDPEKPVPYTKRPMPGFWQGASAEWKVEDQRFVHNRPDVLSWETGPLEEDVVVSGRIVAHLFAATTGTDSDWIVKFIDVYPEDYPDAELRGYQLMIADEVLRGKFRNSFEHPEPVEPNEIVEYVIDLNSRNHCFRKGHKIMVQVQSTWFPLIGRNPQKFIDIPKAKDSDYQKATQKVFRTANYPSHIVIPVVKK